MSLGIVVKGSEGIVLAADSRLTLTATMQDQTQHVVNFDNVTKLLTFAKPNEWIGAVTWGDAVIGTSQNDIRTAQSFVSEFEVGLPDQRLTVSDFAQRMSNFYMDRWRDKMPPNHQTSGMVFCVGGFDEGSAYGSVYLINIPNQPNPEERSPTTLVLRWAVKTNMRCAFSWDMIRASLTRWRKRYSYSQHKSKPCRTP